MMELILYNEHLFISITRDNFMILRNPKIIVRYYAGHNKWSKIRHIKAVDDVIKGRVYAIASKNIFTAIRRMPALQ